MQFRYLIPIIALVALPSLQAEPSVKITEQPDRLVVEMNGERFTEYLFNPAERPFPSFYPILGPGQIPMTRRFPFETVEGEDTDHPHHQSLWFAHSLVNGHNFWAINPLRDGRIPGRTIHKGFKKIDSGGAEGGFVAENDYVASDGTTVMTDTRTVRFIPPKDPNGPRQIDITIAFHASHGTVTFGDDKDGGLAFRMRPELQVVRRNPGKKPAMIPGTGHLLNSEGVEGAETWGKRGLWVDAYGELEGKPVGIALFDHPSNPRHPTYWHSRDYGLVAANPFGKHHFENLEDKNAGQMVIPDGETITFRWRVAFHQGSPKDADVDGLYKAFAGE